MLVKIYEKKTNPNVSFNVSESLLCSPRLHLFGLKCSKNRDIVKYYYNYKIADFYVNLL